MTAGTGKGLAPLEVAGLIDEVGLPGFKLA
jgi:hypothetical protein